MKNTEGRVDELRPEYDLKSMLPKSVRGKYANRFDEGTNVVLLDPDVNKEFKTDREVNAALRLVMQLRQVGGRKSKKSASR